MNAPSRILITGGTGYVGGRLIPLLRDRIGSDQLRLMARRPDYLRARAGDGVEIVAGDVMKPETLVAALEGIDTAYYLIHSMGSADDFENQDRTAARNFASAARTNGVKRIIYLGGLGEQDAALSRHLRSRHEVGEVLKESGAQVIEFRASIVIGSGSLSFELIRSLVQKLPVMICPKWVSTLAQPIAIEDILAYLTLALSHESGDSRVYEIGGPDQVSYGDLMREYARQRGLRRLMIPVPFLSARLSSLWLGLVTPVYATIGRKLVESLKNPTVVSDTSALDAFPVQPMALSAAIERALSKEDSEFASTRWQDAVSSSQAPRRFGGEQFGNRLVDCRTITVNVPPEQAFAPIQRIGGNTGWYYANLLWRIRGFMDLLVGGPGLRRGRRHPTDLKVGDTLDCWRVEKIDAPHVLRLCAEMRLPGRAWLELSVNARDGGSEITQTAMFDPVGLFGLCYWYAIWPLHQLVFAGMLRNIAAAATAKNHDFDFDESRSIRSVDRSVSVAGRWTSLIVFVALCFSAAGTGAFFPPDDWYASLNRPSYAPPNWVFGPVWTALYLMMAVSGWLVWISSVSTGKRLALTLFGVQLILNASWTAIFFGWHQPGWALLDMILLWLAILSTILLFKRHSLIAAVLLVPYLFWVSFAAVLNYGFWSLN